MTIRALLAKLVLAATIALPGCDYLPFGYTPIGQITSAPGQFEGKEVRLKGRARGPLQLAGLKAYILQDETGEIPVITAFAVPAEKSNVALKGIVKSVVIVGGASLGLRVEETERLQ